MAKILIVDDSKTSRKFLRNMLEDAGHEIVSEAVNGVEGVEKFRLYKPDVVTMDITMPVMDGIEAVREIIEIDPGAKVIMVTAAGQKTNMVEALKNPVQDVNIALVGKYTQLHDAYISVVEALKHGGIAERATVNLKWVDSETLTEEKQYTKRKGFFDNLKKKFEN